VVAKKMMAAIASFKFCNLDESEVRTGGEL